VRASRSISRYLRGQAIHIIHCSDVYALILIAAPVVRLRIPVVYNMIFFYEWTRMVALNLLAAFTVSSIVTNSLAVERDLRRRSLLSAKPVKTVHPGVDATVFRPAQAGEPDILRKELALAPGTKVVGMVGRFDIDKGHDVFVEAAAELLRTRSDVKFILLG